MKKPCILALLTALVTLTPACPDGGTRPEGLRRTLEGSGPVIVFDPVADPIPEIPFPNDLATVLDRHSITGRQVNVRMHSPTGLEETIRSNINTLNGFGTFSPITVRFTAELDLCTVGNDTVLVINMNPDSEKYGQVVPLDLGQGNFPLNLEGRPTRKPAPAPEIDFEQSVCRQDMDRDNPRPGQPSPKIVGSFGDNHLTELGVADAKTPLPGRLIGSKAALIDVTHKSLRLAVIPDEVAGTA